MIDGKTKLYVVKSSWYSNEYGFNVNYRFSRSEYLAIKFAQLEHAKFDAYNEDVREHYALTCEMFEMTKQEMIDRGWYDPVNELGIYSDNDGHQYLLSKNMFCAIHNAGTDIERINGLTGDINKLISPLLILTSTFTKFKSMTNILARMAHCKWEIDAFTRGSQRGYAKCYIIQAQGGSHDIRSEND